jgi:uncharacterized protein (TIGR03067 family)
MKLLETNRFFTHALFLGMLVISCKSSNPVNAPAPVKTELEGTWEGTNMDGIDQTQWTYIMALNSIIIQADALEKYRGTFTLDTSASPRHIDIVISKSATASDAGKTIPGLYSLSVNILQITGNGPGSQRPSNMDPPVSVIKFILQ